METHTNKPKQIDRWVDAVIKQYLKTNEDITLEDKIKFLRSRGVMWDDNE